MRLSAFHVSVRIFERHESIKLAVQRANAKREPIEIIGGGSKGFYGRPVDGETLPVGGYRGVIAYEPTELVLTARAGTPLTEIETLLAEQAQMLPFEPPHFESRATLGGTIACGLSGPRRPYTGAARDFVLGVKCMNAAGEALSFGGQVMKNVAGFDVSRLMTGAIGTLGVLLEVSLKVLPRPETEITLTFSASMAEAIERMNHWAGKPLPVSAAGFDGETIFIRLSGAQAAVIAAANVINGERLEDSAQYWDDLREHRLPFFSEDRPLWRLSVPPATPPLALDGDWYLDWGGAQRWLKTDADLTIVRKHALAVGGHAELFRGGDRDGEVFAPLSPTSVSIHRRLKQAFDPNGIFNRGRMYAGL